MVGGWLKEGMAVRRWTESEGLVFGRTGMADAPEGLGANLTQKSLAAFTALAKENEIGSAVAARYALESDLDLVMKKFPKETGGLRKFLDVISGRDVTRTAEGGVAGAPVRRLEKLGIDRDQLLDIITSGRKLDEDEISEAAYRLVHDTQFPLDVFSRPMWMSRHPVAKLFFKFKTFGIRQTQFIYENVAKEAAQGNFAPMAKYVTSAIMMGEAYHVARDLVLGSDKSITLDALKTGKFQADADLGHRMFRNFLAQGGMGIIWDLGYGITDWLVGPVGSTYRAFTDAAPQVFEAAMKGTFGGERDRLKQIPEVIADLAKEDVVAVRHMTEIWNRTKSQAGFSRHIEYSELHNRLLRHAGKQDDPLSFVTDLARQMVTGGARYKTTINTVAYRTASQAIRSGDPEKAASFLAAIITGADNPKQAVATIKSQLQRRSPLGGVSAKERGEFLLSLTPDELSKATETQTRWLEDAGKALEAAARTAERKITARGTR